MSTSMTLWIDSANNRLAGGWNSFVYAGKPLFKEGDDIDITLRWIKRPLNARSSMEEISLIPYTIRFEIGNRAWKPVAGKWYLQFDGDNTELLDYNVSATNLENALNMVPSIVTAGGVSVSQINDDGYKVVFVEDGAQEALTGFGEGLSPISQVVVNVVASGSATTKAACFITLRQESVTQLNSEWVTEDAVVAVAEELRTNLWEVSLTGQPKGGYFTIEVDDGTPVSVPVASDAEDLKTLLGAGYNVTKEGDYRWNISSVDNSAFELGIVSSSNILSFTGQTAKVLIDPVYAAEVLSGVSEVTTTLQISVENQGNRSILLQLPCTLVGNLSL